MTLSELGSLGEFIGSIAVVVSLLYLAVVRESERDGGSLPSATIFLEIDGIQSVALMNDL